MECERTDRQLWRESAPLRLTGKTRGASIANRMPGGQQFICKKCKALSNVQSYGRTREGTYFCVCEHCGAKNQVVRTGASLSQPGLLPVNGLIQ